MHIKSVIILIAVGLESAYWVTLYTIWYFLHCIISNNWSAASLIEIVEVLWLPVAVFLASFLLGFFFNHCDHNTLVYVPVSFSGLDLLLKYAKILLLPVYSWVGSIVETHGLELTPVPLLGLINMADLATKPLCIELVNTTVTFQKHTNRVTEKTGHDKGNIFFSFHISYLTGEKLWLKKLKGMKFNVGNEGSDYFGNRQAISLVASFYWNPCSIPLIEPLPSGINWYKNEMEMWSSQLSSQFKQLQILAEK